MLAQSAGRYDVFEKATISGEELIPVDLPEPLVAGCASRASHRVTLAVSGMACSVDFERPGAAAIFAQRYAAVASSADAGHRVFAVDDAALGPVFGSPNAAQAFHWPYRRALADDDIAFLADCYAMSSFLPTVPGVVTLHAAAVGVPQGVAAIVGDSHAGKSTTAIACARRGLALYTDERCIIGPAGVEPFHRAINLRDGGHRLLTDGIVDDPFADRLRDLATLEGISYTELFDTTAPPPVRPLRSVFLIDGIASEPSISAAKPTDAVRATLKTATTPEFGLDRLARLLACFRNVRCYRLTLGTPHATAALIETTLRGDVEAFA